jgi:glycosyltransferase involved in cell wall biosynthesis
MVIPVTVLMPVHDTPADMLDRALSSVRRQTFSDFEFLVLDDGSRSEPTRSCLELHAAADSRLRVEWEPHRGLTPSLNLGLKRARGELIARQDADDWSEPERLERQIVFLRAHPEIALCGCDAWRHQQNGTLLWRTRLPEAHDEILAAFWSGNPFVHGSVMFRKEAALCAGGYREEFACAQDYDFFWRLAELGGAATLNMPLYHYRYVSCAVTAGRALEQARAHRAARRLAAARQRGEIEDAREALAADGAATQERERLRTALKQADHLMLAGEYARAWRTYGSLLRSAPASGLAWAKLLRCVVFVALPPARKLCFR